MRIRGKRLAGKLQRRDSLFACHGRKRCQEFVERVARFKVVEQILHRDACAHKNGRAAENFRVTMYHWFVHLLPQFPTRKLMIRRLRLLGPNDKLTGADETLARSSYAGGRPVERLVGPTIDGKRDVAKTTDRARAALPT